MKPSAIKNIASLILISLIFSPIRASADAVFLKNGEEQKGIVVEEYVDAFDVDLPRGPVDGFGPLFGVERVVWQRPEVAFETEKLLHDEGGDAPPGWAEQEVDARELEDGQW